MKRICHRHLSFSEAASIKGFEVKNEG